jgi:hypothetical protein
MLSVVLPMNHLPLALVSVASPPLLPHIADSVVFPVQICVCVLGLSHSLNAQFDSAPA